MTKPYKKWGTVVIKYARDIIEIYLCQKIQHPFYTTTVLHTIKGSIKSFPGLKVKKYI